MYIFVLHNTCIKNVLQKGNHNIIMDLLFKLVLYISSLG